MSNQIIKLERDKTTRNSIKIKTKDWYGSLVDGQNLADCLSVVFYYVLNKKLELLKDWKKNKISLKNLSQIIEKNFKVNIHESEDEYILIVLKDKSSIRFAAKKEQGISNVLAQAEDWAETMLEDLKVNTACGL